MTAPAEWTVFWWALGTTLVGAGPIAAIWTVNRDNQFWPALAVVAIGGAVIGSSAVARRLPWPGSVLFAGLFPISLVVALSMHAWTTDGEFGWGAVIGWGVALGVGALPFVGAARSSLTWFRWWVVAWSVMSVTLLFAYGLGLVFVPLAVSAWLSQRHYRRRHAVMAGQSVPGTV